MVSIPVAPKKFLTLPLGEIKPAGWLQDQVTGTLSMISATGVTNIGQLMVQTNGLAGHEHDFYH